MNYISIIDIGINNIQSVVSAINHQGHETIITKNKKKNHELFCVSITRSWIFS